MSLGNLTVKTHQLNPSGPGWLLFWSKHLTSSQMGPRTTRQVALDWIIPKVLSNSNVL